MIDFSKVKVGDKVRLAAEGVVTMVDNHYATRPLRVRTGREWGSPGVWVYADQVVAHLPAPRPFVKGDRVKTKSSNNSNVHTFLAEVEDTAVCRTDSGYVITIGPMSNLEHVD